MNPRRNHNEATRQQKLAEKRYARGNAQFCLTLNDTLKFETPAQLFVGLLLLTTALASCRPVDATKTKRAHLHHVDKSLTQPISLNFVDASQKLINCIDKDLGRSIGKICFFEGKKYHLKEASLEDATKLVASEHNFRFLNNIGIGVPTAKFFQEGNKIYLATEDVERFKTINDVHKDSGWTQDAVRLRKQVKKRIGEYGLSQFAVANTFLDDLHLLNWGYAGNQLYIVDADYISPNTYKEFFEMASANLKKGYQLPLTLRNIRDMKTIYESMLAKPAPKIHVNAVDMSNEFYKNVLNVFIESCSKILEQMEKQKRENKIFPPRYLQELLASHIEDLAKQFSPAIPAMKQEL
jgi:hypothetical protein